MCLFMFLFNLCICFIHIHFNHVLILQSDNSSYELLFFVVFYPTLNKFYCIIVLYCIRCLDTYQTHFFCIIQLPQMCNDPLFWLQVQFLPPKNTLKLGIFLLLVNNRALRKHNISQIQCLDTYQKLFFVFLRPPRCATTPYLVCRINFGQKKMTSKLVIFFWLIKNQTFFNRHIPNKTYFFVFLGPHRCSRTHYFLPLTIFYPF